MPFLRQDADNTLAETLGNLGGALSQSLNPMNQMRAQDMLAQMRQRQWELQHLQTIDAANRNAADVYERRNPFNEDPAALAVSAARIRNGQGDLNGSITALTAATTFKERQDAAALISARHPDWDPARVASAVADIGSGRKNLPEVESDVAGADLSTAKTGATIRGAQAAGHTAAGLPNATPEAGPLAEAEVYSDPGKAAALVAAGRVRGASGNLSPADIDKLNADRAAAGMPQLPLGTSPLVEMQPAYDAATAAREGEIARQKGVGEAIGKGVAPTGNVFFGGPPNSPGNKLGAPPAVGGSPPQNVTIPDPANPSASPTPVVTSVATPENPNAVVVGESAADATRRGAVDTATRAQLQEAVDGGVAGRKMLVTLDRLKTLAQLATTGPGMAQLPGWVTAWLAEKGIVATDRQAIRNEMKSLFNAQIPELRKDMGVKFEAGPELSAQAKMIGDPNQTLQTLMGIFARQEAIAQLAVQRRELAMRALYPDQPNALSRSDYLKEDAKVYDNLQNVMNQIMQGNNVYGAEPPAADQSQDFYFENGRRVPITH